MAFERMLEDALRDIERSSCDAAGRRLAADRLSVLVKAIDGLLFEFEELNLRGVDRVPVQLRQRSARLLEMLPAAGQNALQVRYRVGPMMSVLFDAQRSLLLKRNPELAAEFSEEPE